MRRRSLWPQVGRDPAGRRDPHPELVAPVGRAAAEIRHGGVIGEVRRDRIEGREPSADAEHRRLDLRLEGAEQPVPEDENAAVVLVEIAIVDPVVDAVIGGRGKHPVEPAEFADEFGVDPELVEEIDQPDPDEHDRGNAGDRHRQIEHPAEQNAGARLAERRREIEVVALVMDDMGRPEQADLVIDAVVPVVEEIVDDQRADPDAPVVAPEREQGNVVVDQHVDADAERQHEDARDLAEDARRQRPDRVVEAIDVSSRRDPDHELSRHQDDEDRNRINDDVQAVSSRPSRRRAGPPSASQPEFAVRPEAHQFQCLVVRLAVDQHEVRADMTVPVVFPLSSSMGAL